MMIESSKVIPMISCLKIGFHVTKHCICFVPVKCSEPVLPYSAFIFMFCDTAVSKEPQCFSSINQKLVFFCLKDVKNSVNQELTCK